MRKVIDPAPTIHYRQYHHIVPLGDRLEYLLVLPSTHANLDLSSSLQLQNLPHPNK